MQYANTIMARIDAKCGTTQNGPPYCLGIDAALGTSPFAPNYAANPFSPTLNVGAYARWAIGYWHGLHWEEEGLPKYLAPTPPLSALPKAGQTPAVAAIFAAARQGRARPKPKTLNTKNGGTNAKR